MNRHTLRRDLENTMIGRLKFKGILAVSAILELMNMIEILEQKVQDLSEGKEYVGDVR